MPDSPPPAQLDTSETATVYLYEGNANTYVRLSPNAHTLLRLVRSGRSFQEIAGVVNRNDPEGAVTADDVEAAYHEIAEKIEAMESESALETSGFWGKVELLSAATVQRISSALTGAFVRPLVVGTGIVAATALAAAVQMPAPVPEAGGMQIAAAYVLLLVSLLGHELGHTAACVRYGAPVGEIGGTLYLIYPALYSDVTSVWSLERRQRVIVDLSGIYFQSLFGAAYVAAYAATGLATFYVAYVLVGISLAFSLNPIFKFDGYWVVADALGITNLSKQPGRLIKHAWHRLRGDTPDPLPWSPRIVQLLGAYTVASVGVWTYFASIILPAVGARLMGYPDAVAALGRSLLDPSLPLPDMTRFAVSTLFALTAGLILFRIGGKVREKGRHLFNTTLSYVRRLRTSASQ